MDISKRVIEQLETLAAHGPQAVEALILDSAQQQGCIVGLEATDDGLGVSINLEDHDRYSVTLRRLEVGHRDLDGQRTVAEKLQHCADQLVRRLTYLESPLALLELDPESGVAQLRSESPEKQGEAISYWEAVVEVRPQFKISLARHCWRPNGREREEQIYPATFATVGRLAEDIAECLAGITK